MWFSSHFLYLIFSELLDFKVMVFIAFQTFGPLFPSLYITYISLYRCVFCTSLSLSLLNWPTVAFNLGRRQWQPTPVLLPGKSHGRRSLVGFIQSMGSLESDTTERLHFRFSLSCIGEGNGNPLHCSCLENPRDGGAWWAAVYGIAQSDTTEVT